MADDGEAHGGNLTDSAGASLTTMMRTVITPPFERFYAETSEPVFAFLVRRLGRAAAEDAFQETFLRALRAYGELAHAENLRGWAFTIAARVAVDDLRRRGAPTTTNTAAELASTDGRPAFAELEHLTDELPPTERAAVVLRFGYDLDYDDIGDALGSSADAARQAASSGVRRLRARVRTTHSPSGS
jgi:RNA polymerase sigma factor (sigma-70 family)